MDKPQRMPDDLECSECNGKARELRGAAEEERARRMKCRKCDADSWENQAKGMVQLNSDE